MAKQAVEGVVASSTASSQSEQVSDQTDLVALVGSLMREVEELRDRADNQDSRTSKWLTSEEMDGLDDDNPYKQDAWDPENIMANLKGKDDDGQAQQMFFGTDSHAIPPMLLRRFGPKFKIGNRVRVNPDAKIYGSEQVWKSALDEMGSSGRGIVKKVVHLKDNGEWKYLVRVPGITTKNGSGFAESELLPIHQKVTKYVVEEQQ